MIRVRALGASGVGGLTANEDGEGTFGYSLRSQIRPRQVGHELLLQNLPNSMISKTVLIISRLQVSAICEACRLLMSEVLLGTHRFNSAEVMVYIGPPTAALLLLGAAYQEQGAFTATGLHHCLEPKL